MLSVDEALEHILALVPQPRPETVALAQVAGRILAAPLTARHYQPPFDSSAMDGYAVRTGDVEPGTPLRLVGTAQAGQRFVGMLQRGQCVRIFTGAPLPIGADAVIMQEQAQANGNAISFDVVPAQWQSVRRRGSDFAEGEPLLPAGTLMRAAGVALAAAANRPTLTVTRRPRIALLATGDELVAVGGHLGLDEIVASNSYALAALLGPYVESVLDLGIVRDDRVSLDAALLRAFDSGVDVLVTTGGASVGDHDLVRPALADLGVELAFWKIAMRPGKPLMFGTRGRTLVFGLPGNPVSAFVTALVMVLPALRAFAGDPQPLGGRYALPLGAPIPRGGPRRHFVRATIALGSDGAPYAMPIAETDSAHLSSLAGADALIVQPENDPGRQVHELVEVIPLPTQ